MALEKLIEELNETMLTLIATLQGGNIIDAEDDDEPTPAKKAPAKKKAPARKKAAKKTPAKKKTNYDRDVKPQVLIAIATPEGREEVKELLEEYEVKKATEIEADDYPEFLTGINAIIDKYDDE